jgi:hypothetical protein
MQEHVDGAVSSHAIGLFDEAIPGGTKPSGWPSMRIRDAVHDSGGQFRSFKRSNQDAVTPMFHRGELTS